MDRRRTSRVGIDAVPSWARTARARSRMARVVDQAEAPDLAAEKEVLRHGQVLGEQDFLMHEDDAVCSASTGPEKVNRPAIEMRLPFVGGR